MTINHPAPLFQLFWFLILASSSITAKADSVDLIIAADYIVTMDDENTVITDGAIAIDKGLIVAIDSRTSIEKAFTARQKIEGKNRVLMPGLINGHTHAAMTLFRGIADDLPLME